MLMTMGGKTPEASSGAVMVSPSLTLSWMALTALAMMTLPAVSLTMVRAWRMGTPLLTSVPRVRVKREMAILLTTGPTTGTLSLNLSKAWRPNLVRTESMKATTNTAITPRGIMAWSLTVSLMASTKRVKAGSWAPSNMPANTSLNLGMTYTIRMLRMAMATKSTATG